MFRFETKIFHSNASDKGEISIEILDDKFAPYVIIPTVILHVLSILVNP